MPEIVARTFAWLFVAENTILLGILCYLAGRDLFKEPRP